MIATQSVPRLDFSFVFSKLRKIPYWNCPLIGSFDYKSSQWVLRSSKSSLLTQTGFKSYLMSNPIAHFATKIKTPWWGFFVVTNIFIVVTIKISRPRLAVSVVTETSLRLAQVQKNPKQLGFFVLCAREDLNLHARRHIHLKDACLPFQHSRIYYQHIPKDPPIILKALAIFN